MNIESRRAVEALRAGVPNRSAVEFLRLGQPAIEARFDRLLGTAGSNEATSGFIIGGEFGSGKSHVLQYLKRTALSRGFAVSLVTISKETPLSSLEDVFKAAIRELGLPDRLSGDFNEVATKLQPTSEAYRDFETRLRAGEGNLNPLFPATLLISRSVHGNEELCDHIYNFWAGGRINVAEIKREVKLQRLTDLSISRYRAADIAPERFVFSAGLIKAAGYCGWIVLLDETELIASFSLQARAKAYTGLAWLLGYGNRHVVGLGVVAAATKEFTGVILNEKNGDQIKIPLSKLAERDPALVESAVQALRIIDEGAGHWEHIKAHSAGDLDNVFRDVRELYRRAFDWESLDADRPPYTDVARSMRMHVREWITRWDLERLDPTYSASIESQVVTPDLAEREGLEGFSEIDDTDSDS
jgi:hypothetical protein